MTCPLCGDRSPCWRCDASYPGIPGQPPEVKPGFATPSGPHVEAPTRAGDDETVGRWCPWTCIPCGDPPPAYVECSMCGAWRCPHPEAHVERVDGGTTYCRCGAFMRLGSLDWERPEDQPTATAGPTPDVHPTAEVPPASAVQVRRALDAKDALLRRALAMLRGIRLVEAEVRPGPYHVELVGFHVGDVARLCVAIEMELEFVDPLEGA